MVPNACMLYTRILYSLVRDESEIIFCFEIGDVLVVTGLT